MNARSSRWSCIWSWNRSRSPQTYVTSTSLPMTAKDLFQAPQGISHHTCRNNVQQNHSLMSARPLLLFALSILLAAAFGIFNMLFVRYPFVHQVSIWRFLWPVVTQMRGVASILSGNDQTLHGSVAEDRTMCNIHERVTEDNMFGWWPKLYWTANGITACSVLYIT